MKPYKLILFFLFSANIIFGQQDSADVSLKAITKQKKKAEFGPNKTHYVHGYFNFLFATPPKEGNDADIFYGKTHSFSLGVRYRFKVANFFALGTGLNYTYYAWHFKQTDIKKIPVATLYDKEKLKINTVGGEAFLRFILTKGKTAQMGNYIDLGGFIDWDYYDSRQFSNFVNLTDPNGYATNTGVQSKLNYLNKINCGAELRIGHKKITVFARYRLSDMFTPDYKTTVSSTELPRLMAGFEIGF
jgi:hypothetical protein